MAYWVDEEKIEYAHQSMISVSVFTKLANALYKERCFDDGEKNYSTSW